MVGSQLKEETVNAVTILRLRYRAFSFLLLTFLSVRSTSPAFSMNQTPNVNNFLLCLSQVHDADNSHLDSINDTNFSTRHGDHDHDHDHDHDSHDLLVSKVVAMVVLFCATSLVGAIPFLLNRHFKWTENNTNARSATVVQCLLYFGGGVLLCTTFLHLLPEVQETIEHLEECHVLPDLRFELAEMLMCCGFFLMYLIEELIHSYIHRQQSLLEKDAAGAAFERGHSVRNSYLMKGNQKEKEQIASAPPLTVVESVGCTDTGEVKSNDISRVQDLIANDFEQQKYQTLEPTKYSDQSEQLDHHHHFQHHHPNSHHQHHNHDAHGHSHLPIGSDSDSDMMTSSLRGLLIVLALSLHELFEGMAIGLEGSASAVWFMFGAVSAHKLVLSFCVAVELIVARTRFSLSVIYVMTFATVSPLGIGIGILVSHNDDSTQTSILSAILQGLACGTLLYVVFFEILSRNRSGLLAYLSLIVGFGFMFGLQQLGGEEHDHSHGGCKDASEEFKGITKSLIYHHDDHTDHDHSDHSHQPAATTTAQTGSTFEQQLILLRDASKELLSRIKKDA